MRKCKIPEVHGDIISGSCKIFTDLLDLFRNNPNCDTKPQKKCQCCSETAHKIVQ